MSSIPSETYEYNSAMLKKLPPRLRMFFRHVIFGSLGWLSAIGANAIYKGDAKFPWDLMIGLMLGSVIGALTRKIPEDSLKSYQRDTIEK